jgi:hypothetical protein
MNDKIDNRSLGVSVDDKSYNQAVLNNIFNTSKGPEPNVSSSAMKQTYSSQQINKRGQSRPKTANKEFCGRDEKVDVDIYYRIKDENIHLKKVIENQNLNIKRLNANFEKVKHNVVVERRLADRKVVPLDGGMDMEFETLKNENAKLIEKTKKMSTIIQGLQTQKCTHVQPRKNLVSAKHNIDKQNETNDYLASINFLRQQLKDSANEVQRLHAELYGGDAKKLKNMGNYSKDVIFFKTSLEINLINYQKSRQNTKRLKCNSRLISKF